MTRTRVSRSPTALTEVIKLPSPLGLKPCVCFDGAEKACSEWRVDARAIGNDRTSDRITKSEICDRILQARLTESRA
jgi:hypothetical protein